MKKLNVIKCIFLILMLLVPFFASVRAQNCDPNILKALEQTRVTAFDKVTKGEIGSLFIKYPMKGVTYTFTDQAGTSYSYTHSGGSNSADVSVGVVNTERKFALKAVMGDCVYQTSFIYKLTPVTTLGIAVRVEHEWCNGAGALYYKIVGGDTSKYNFYHRLQGGAYDGLPSPVGGVTTLTSGTYEVKAEPKAGAPAVAPVSGLQIRSLDQTVDYTLTDLPSKCTGQLPGLRVNVTSGSYPLLFSLYDNTGTTPVPGFYRQTSNVFTNVPPGNYKVKVEDFCAISGGAATTKPHVVPNTMIDFTETYLGTMQEYACDYLSFRQLGIKGDNLRAAFEAGSLPFPFTLKFQLKEPAPSTTVHTVSRTFNNQNDVSLFLTPHPNSTELLLVKENLRGERIPKKAGQWEIKAIVSACGTDKTLTAKTVTFKSLFDDFAVYEGGASETTACHSTNIVLSNTTSMDMSLDIYVVVDLAPAGFKYEEAGFFKLTTSNPLLHNKYVKKIHYYGAANNAYPIVAPEYINQGDQFKFRVVDAECDPDRNSGELPLTITHPTNNEPTDLWIHNTQSCRGVTSTGAPYGTFLFSRTRGSEITEIKILSFDGNPSDLPFTLPYTLPISNRINSDTWALYDLPAGKYDISITNRCGNTKLWPNQKLFGETFSFTWSEGCTPSLNAIIGQPEIRAYQSYSVNYFVQHFENGEWKDVERINLNSSALSTSYNKTFTETRLKEGKFRVLRKIKYGDNGKICDIVVSEKEYIGDLKNPTAIGAGCPNGKYHIAIIANGGTPPYTYEWVSTTPVGSTTPVPSGHPAQPNDNFFVDLTNTDPNTTYTFAVTDACGNRRTVDTSLAGVATPEIKVDAGENAFYCTGQQATLSLPNIKGITVKWYRSDAPSTILGTGNSLTITVAPDDFVTGNTYMVELEMPARPDVASCISDAINNNFAYQFKSKNFVTPIPPTRNDITICAESNTTQDLTQLFQNIPTLSPGVTATIREKTGAIYVPDNNTITIGNMKGEYTFVYTLYEPCRKVIGTPVEATLTVNRKINPNTKSNIKICDPSITMDVLKSLVLAGSPEVASLALDFHWYQNNTDAQNQQNESAGSYAISLSPGQKKTVYVRYSKLGYCSGEPKPVEVEREATVAPKALTNPDCSITTVRTLKALVDPVDSSNVIIYKNGTELGDDMLIEEYTPTMYTYSKRLYQCIPPAQALTFSYKERTAAAPQQVGVCTFPGYQNASTVKVTDIKTKIQAQYVGKTIRIYQNNSELSAANATVYFMATDVYFTVEESGKCPSLQQKVTLQQAPFSVATLLPALSICEDTTIAELKAEIGAQGLSNVRIYSSSLATEESDDKFVVWGNPYYYRVVETGKCPSDLIPLTFTNKGNKTNATPKLYEVCIPQGNTAKIADLKSVITGGEVKIFKRNNDNTWSDPLDDNTTANENDAYFYTLRETGKCPSDKTAISLVISYKTTTPTAPADPKWCSGKKVSDLKSYIASKGVTGTIKIYESATATTELADATVLEKNKSYHFTTHDGNPQHCESNRVALTVTIYASPTITTHPLTPSTPPCGGSRLTLSVVATGDDISYQWYKNTTNDNTSGTAITGKTSATFDPPTDTVETTYYYVKVSSGKGCTAAVSNTAKVEVTKPTKITRQPDNISHCFRALPPPSRLQVTAEGTGTLRYQWYLKNNNYPSGTAVPNVPGNTGQDAFYNPPIDSPHTTTYYVEVTSDCGTVTSDEIVVNVIPYPSFKSGGNLTTNDEATYCKGDTSVRKLKVDVQQGAGTPVYQWYKATSPMGTGQEIDRAWNNEYTPDVSQAGTFYYYVTVRNQRDCIEETTSNKVKIVVNETTAIVDDLSEDEVKYCKGVTANALTVKMKGTPNYTYTWYRATNTTEIGTVVRTQTSATAVQDSYTPSAADEGTFYYYVKVHSSCGDDKTSKRAKITVTKPTKITTDLSEDEVNYCKGATPVSKLSVSAEGTPNISYQWYSATTANGTGTAITGETSNEYTPVVTAVGTTYYYVVVHSSCGSDVTSKRAKITVTKPTAITADLSETEVSYCKDVTNAAKLTVTAEGTGTLSYQWYSVTNGTSNAITGATTHEYTPPTTEVGTTYYYVKVSSTCGEVTSKRAKITVTKLTKITTDLSEDEVNYCKAATPVTKLSVAAEGTPNITYQWYSATTANGAGTAITGETTHEYTPVVTTVGTTYYYVVVHSSCGSDVTSKRAKITVTKPTAITADLSETEVKYCKGATNAAKLTVTAEGTPTIEYKWYKARNATDAGTEISGATTHEYTPLTTEVGTSYYYVVVHSSCGDDKTSKRAKITITKPTTITTDLSTTEVKYCKDEPSPAALTVEAEGTGNLSYTWYKVKEGTSTVTPIAGQTTATLAASAIEVATRGTTYYYVVVHSDCGSDVTSARAKVTITDPDTPTVSDQTFCNAATVADLRPNDSDIKWYASLTGGAPLTDGTRALAHGNKYYAARTLGSCESARAEVTVTIISLAKPIVSEDTVAACGQPNVWAITTGFDTNATYSFVKEDDTPVSGGQITGASHKITGLDPGRYKVIATKGSCTQKSDVFEVKAALRRPDIPDLEIVPASCGVLTKAKVNNHVAEQTYWYNGTEIPYNDTTHELTLAPGNYTIKAKNREGCESDPSRPFVIEDAKPVPVAPVVSLTPETCEKRTVAKVENHVAGQTYWYNGTEIHYDTASHELTLDPGSYTIIAKNTAGCESEASNIVIKNNKPTTRIVTDPQDPLDKTYQLGERANELRVTINGTALSYKWFRNTSRDYSGADVAEVARTETYVPPTNKVGIFYYWLEITAECGGDNEGKTRSGIAKIEVIDQRKAIRAIDDNFGKISNTANTTTTQSIFSSGVDTMEGVLGVLTTNKVDIHYGELKHNGTVLTQPDANITLNGDGTLSVKQNTPEGQYEYTYKICEKGTTNCSNEATVKFEVTATRIIANDDGIWEVGRTGGLLPNVLDNDILGGQIGLTISDVIIERNAAEAAPDPKISIETDGRVSVKSGLTPGDYIYYYTIKERANVANVANAKVRIKVVNFAAVGDEFELVNTPTQEQTTPSVLLNDELDNTKGLTPGANLVLTPGDKNLDTLIMNPDGTITIAPNTPNGVYRYNYRICTVRPAECREAQAVIKLYTVIAKEDDYSSTPVNTTLEAKTIGNVLEDDDYPGKPDYSNVDLSVVGNSHGIELKPNGDVVVPQGMPAGNYVIRYRLCIAGQTDDNSCQEADIKIVVFQDKPLTIYNGISANGDGQNDYFHIESIERYPINNLKIFNRWGVLVYEKDGYRNDTEPFDGHSNGRATISAGSKLPQGTYYYILEYQDSVGQTQTNQGWLYLKY